MVNISITTQTSARTFETYTFEIANASPTAVKSAIATAERVARENGKGFVVTAVSTEAQL